MEMKKFEEFYSLCERTARKKQRESCQKKSSSCFWKRQEMLWLGSAEENADETRNACF